MSIKYYKVSKYLNLDSLSPVDFFISEYIDEIDNYILISKNFCYKIYSINNDGSENLINTVCNTQSFNVLSKDNVICVYKANDLESFNYALLYKNMHSLNDNQMLSIDCSGLDILSSYNDFKNQIEDKILNFIQNSFISDKIYSFVFMPNIPSGFYHEGEIVSTVTRISRIKYEFNLKEKNPSYNRKVFKRYDDIDRGFFYICSRLDSCSSFYREQLFNNTLNVKNNTLPYGKIYLDPYSGLFDEESKKYTNSILYASNNSVSKINLEKYITQLVDPYVDSIIPYLENDSFYWGWGTESGSLSFFKDTSSSRVFFYNADPEGGKTFLDIDSTNWASLAIRSGYISSAGPKSYSLVDSYLNPDAFFNCLFQGGTLGEAMYFSLPYLNYTMDFIGDPLLSFSFYNADPVDNKYPVNYSIQYLLDNISETICGIVQKSNNFNEITNLIVGTRNLNLSKDLLLSSYSLLKKNSSSVYTRDIDALKQNISNYIYNIIERDLSKNQFENISFYINKYNIKVSNVLVNSFDSLFFSNNINIENFYNEGFWYFEFITKNNNDGNIGNVNFLLEISDKSDFSNIILSKNTINSVENWFYEDTDYNRYIMEKDGLKYYFLGKKIRYESKSDEYLQRGKIYYFRISQIINNIYSDFYTYRKIIFS